MQDVDEMTYEEATAEIEQTFNEAGVTCVLIRMEPDRAYGFDGKTSADPRKWATRFAVMFISQGGGQFATQYSCGSAHATRWGMENKAKVRRQLLKMCKSVAAPWEPLVNPRHGGISIDGADLVAAMHEVYTPPKVDVMASVLMDGGDRAHESSFEQWWDEYGQELFGETDPPEALRVYEALVTASRWLTKTFTHVQLDRLVELARSL